MIITLKKVSVRKVTREKGKSLCIVLALFLTAVMFIVVFSTYFFIKGAFNEASRSSGSWLGDAVLAVTDKEADLISRSKLVSDTAQGYHIGAIYNSMGFVDIELVSYEDKLAYWMKSYPTEGDMPKKDNEIVVSDKYLSDTNLQFKKGEELEVTYFVDGQEYTDEFVLVGTYEGDIYTKNVMLFSLDFYNVVRGRIEEQGKDSNDILYKMVGVTYASSADIEAATNQLMTEIGFDKENGLYAVNNEELNPGSVVGADIYAVLILIIVFIILIGYLFISNIFSISISQDTKFYGKLATNGVLEKEIKKMIKLENNILFVAAMIPALVTGLLFTRTILPGILKSFFTFQVENKSNVMVFVWAVLFAYFTLFISSRKAIKIARKTPPMAMKKYIHMLKPVKAYNNRNCLNKFVMRKFRSDKKNAIKIFLSIAFSILLANLFYTVVVGFNEEEYISSETVADYIVADTTFYSQRDARKRETISQEELSACDGLPGLIQSGGGGTYGLNVVMNDIQIKEYDEIIGDSNLNNPEPGNMYTYLYGLDDIMVDKMEVLEGEIDLVQYHSGKYIIVDSLGDEGETCFHVGDNITIPFQNGDSVTYSVMAIAELPYDISFGSKWMGSSNLFLPFAEWSSRTGIEEYYMYTYDVAEEYRKEWDASLSSTVKENPTLTYQSAKTLADDNKELMNEIKAVGFVLSGILLCMGMMNFINCMASSVHSRRRELAIIQSMGTTEAELVMALVKEGMLYMLGGVVLGCVFSIPGTYWAVDSILTLYYIHYGFYPFIYILFSLIGIVSAILVPWIAYTFMDKREPFLARIRSCRE